MKKTALCLLAAFALAALYFLSTGPVVRFGQPRHTAIAMRFYAPLNWLDNNCRPFSYALTWYVGLWERKPAN
jgi:hypothetical protein